MYMEGDYKMVMWGLEVTRGARLPACDSNDPRRHGPITIVNKQPTNGCEPTRLDDGAAQISLQLHQAHLGRGLFGLEVHWADRRRRARRRR